MPDHSCESSCQVPLSGEHAVCWYISPWHPFTAISFPQAYILLPHSTISSVHSPFRQIFIHPLCHHYSPFIPMLTHSNSIWPPLQDPPQPIHPCSASPPCYASSVVSFLITLRDALYGNFGWLKPRNVTSLIRVPSKSLPAHALNKQATHHVLVMSEDESIKNLPGPLGMSTKRRGEKLAGQTWGCWRCKWFSIHMKKMTTNSVM